MKCQNCKVNEATQKVMCNINGNKSEMYLCPECAKEITESIVPSAQSFYDDFSLGSLAGALFGMNPLSHVSEPEILKAKRQCPNCKTTYDEFSSSGKLGCSCCYETFHDRRLRPLTQIHGTFEHIGKIPSRSGQKLKTSRKIEKLNMELSDAITKQEFEKAAELRDEINKLKGEK